MSFLEMPGTFTEDSSAEDDVTPREDGNQAERFTAIRVRDTKTGRFVAAPTLVAKKLSMPKGVTRIAEASTAGIIGGVIANQAPQNNRSWKTNKKRLKEHLDDDMSVKLVKKSYVPGKGFVKASELGRQGLREAARLRETERYFPNSETISFRGKQRAKDQAYREWHKDMTDIVDDAKKGKVTMQGPKNSVMYAPGKGDSAMPPGAGAYAVRTGGRRGGRVMVVPKDATNHTINHEIAHLTPKRSSFRMYEILQDPAKTMREEARADMLGSAKGYYKSKGSPESGYIEAARNEDLSRRIQASHYRVQDFRSGDMYSDESMNGFRGVQDKMAASGYKFRGNQYVDEKGQRRRQQLEAAGIIGLVSGAGGGAYAFKRHQKKSKS